MYGATVKFYLFHSRALLLSSTTFPYSFPVSVLIIPCELSYKVRVFREINTIVIHDPVRLVEIISDYFVCTEGRQQDPSRGADTS